MRDVERAANELEAETARLREVERRVEAARVEHYAAGDSVSAAQGELYEVNSEVSRLEAELRFVAETRQRLDAQLAHLALQIEQWERQRAELTEAAAMWQQRRAEAAARIAAAEGQHADEEARLPEHEAAHRTAQAALDEARDAAVRSEQALQVEQTHLAHAERMLEQLRVREERLATEREQLVAPEPARLSDIAQGIAAAAAEVDGATGRIRELQEDLPVLEAARGAALARLQEIEREANTREGRLATLRRIQEQVEEGGEINEWLGKHQLQGLPRLWQKITVEPGWETGIESVLRERLHALQLADPNRLARLLEDPPPAKLSLFTPSTASGQRVTEAAFRPLAALVRCTDEAARPLIEDWLAGCFAHDGMPSLTTRLGLPPGAVLVNRDGHQFTRYGVSFHGPDSGDAGILARQREIEALAAELDVLAHGVGEAREVYAAAERALALRRDQIAVLQGQEAERQSVRHELQLEELRINESIARVRERAEQIDVERQGIARERDVEAGARSEAGVRIGRYQSEIESVHARLDRARSDFEARGSALNAQREVIQTAAREVQEALFAERECLSKLNEIERSIKVLSEQLTQALADRSSTQSELAGRRDEGLREELQAGLANRVDREQKLAAARGRLEKIGETLRGADEERLAAEQKLPPLRDRIGELRLKEQAARLGVEQFAGQLAEAGADEAALAQAFEANKVRPGALQAEIQRLHQAMDDLGAINMAALEELGIAAERKAFLDAQAADLREALDTLENAIRRIDRETREMLQQTFDEANRHFGELFPRLFGGGEAKLVMTGEEILDAGIEVRAQPPGKRNSTIHLLSGGEKALTAISLIFALFQLNPAPFCLLDEVDAPLDDTNTERFCNLVKHMSEQTQFLFISHNKITMEIAAQLVGVTMPEQGVSRVVAVDIEEALRLSEAAAA